MLLRVLGCYLFNEGAYLQFLSPLTGRDGESKVGCQFKNQKINRGRQVASAIGLVCLASNFFLCLVSSGQVSD